MESVKDVLNSFKERLTNPFLGAFIISWLIFNYDIIITLLVYDEKIWHTYGQDTVLDFIKSRLCIKKSLWYPLASALGYVLLFPVLKNLVNIYMAFSGKWGSKSVFSVSKEGAVSMERYFRMKRRVKEQIERLKEAVKEESEYLDKINELEIKNNEVTSNLSKERAKGNELELERDDLEKRLGALIEDSRQTRNLLREYEKNRKINKLNGYWKITWQFDGDELSKRFNFINNEILLMEGNVWPVVGSITGYREIDDGKIIFMRVSNTQWTSYIFGQNPMYTIVELQKVKEAKYIGTEGNSVSVIYERVNKRIQSPSTTHTA